MNTLSSLEKQQVGLRVPKYLLDEIDEFTKTFSVNRSEVIIEAIKSYVEAQKENIFYNDISKVSVPVYVPGALHSPGTGC